MVNGFLTCPVCWFLVHSEILPTCLQVDLVISDQYSFKIMCNVRIYAEKTTLLRGFLTTAQSWLKLLATEVKTKQTNDNFKVKIFRL